MKDLMVTTETGIVKGLFGWDPRVITFKGIPYAKPPVGNLRWKAPEPAEPWEGVKEAYTYAPMSVQPHPGTNPEEFWTREIHPTGPDFKMSEDCLYLNVFTPARTGNEKLPVLFYIHGGGFKGGYPYEVEFDWEHMAKKGIVVVAATYRLGVMGFLTHPLLTEENPGASIGNFGLMDQLAALRWTKRNIKAFGGDPSRITIAGQSAGAGSVQDLLISPMVEDGLISGAIMESGVTINFGDLPSPLDPVTLETAEANSKKLFELAKVSSLEEARNLSAEELVRIEDKEMGPGFHFQPVLDNIFLTENPVSAYFSGRSKPVPVLAGYNRDETRGFMRLFTTLPSSKAEFDEFSDRYGASKEKFLSMVNASSDKEIDELFDRDCFADLIAGTRCLGHLQARRSIPAYLYEFDPFIPGDDNAGSYHGCEMWFAYDSLARCWRPFEGKHYDLANKTSAYWANFVKHQDPNGTDSFGRSLPEWRSYKEDDPALMVFHDEPELTVNKDDEIMNFRMQFCEDSLSS